MEQILDVIIFFVMVLMLECVIVMIIAHKKSKIKIKKNSILNKKAYDFIYNHSLTKEMTEYLSESNHFIIVLSIALAISLLYITDFDKNIFNINNYITMLLAVIVGSIFSVLQNKSEAIVEERLKLSNQYEDIMKKYDFTIKERNENLLAVDSDKDQFLPVFVDYIKEDNSKIEISSDKKNVYYRTPREIKDVKRDIFMVHKTSNIYNQLNIRVKSWEYEGKTFKINTERTTYYHSLITNRAMDYDIVPNMTVRDLLQYGPFLPKLSESKLSNHLGFNVLIITSDKKLMMIKRNYEVSIAKGKYATPVSASLKAKYCLNESKEFTTEGLQNAIFKEILDEVKIKEDKIVGFDIEKNIIAAYRYIIEGNKPQLAVYANVDMTSSEIKEKYEKSLKNVSSKAREKRAEIDGTLFEFIDFKIIVKAYKEKAKIFHMDSIELEGKKYNMDPSSVAAFKIVLDYAEKNNFKILLGDGEKFEI